MLANGLHVAILADSEIVAGRERQFPQFPKRVSRHRRRFTRRMRCLKYTIH